MRCLASCHASDRARRCSCPSRYGHRRKRTRPMSSGAYRIPGDGGRPRPGGRRVRPKLLHPVIYASRFRIGSISWRPCRRLAGRPSRGGASDIVKWEGLACSGDSRGRLLGLPPLRGPPAPTVIKLPKGYHVPPHTHPKPEVVTILTGTLRLGEGSSADQSKADPLPAGSFFVISPGMQHYVYADEEIVLQLNSNGTWGMTYVNEKDDPRKTQ